MQAGVEGWGGLRVGVAWREWGGAPEGLFSQLMTRNTLLFFAGQTFAVHKRVESSDWRQKLWRKAVVSSDVNRCLFYACMHCVCHKQAGWEVLGPDVEIAWMIISRIAAETAASCYNIMLWHYSNDYSQSLFMSSYCVFELSAELCFDKLGA